MTGSGERAIMGGVQNPLRPSGDHELSSGLCDHKAKRPALRGVFERLARWWCSHVHHRIMIVRNEYECQTCFRRFPNIMAKESNNAQKS